MALRCLAKPALIIAHQRSGSTMLCEALSNHPDIFCVREEPYHRNSLWRRSCKDPARIIWSQHYYRLSMFRIMANSILGGKPGLLALIKAKKPKIIHLKRVDLLRQAISIEINEMDLKDHPTHTWKSLDPKPVKLNTGRVVHRIRVLQQEHYDCVKLLASLGVEYVTITYEELLGDLEEARTLRVGHLLRFLEVEVLPLKVNLRKLHRGSLDDLVVNLSELSSHPTVAGYL